MLSRDLETAEREVVRSVELFRDLAQDQGVGRGLGVLGFVLLYKSDLAGADRVLEEALVTVEGCDDAWGRAKFCSVSV